MVNGQRITTPIHGVMLMLNTHTPSLVGVLNWIWLLVINPTTHNIPLLSISMRSTSTIGMVHCCNQVWLTMANGQCTTTLIHGVRLMHNIHTPSLVGVHNWIWLLVINPTMHNIPLLSINMRLTSTIGMVHCYNRVWLTTVSGQCTTTLIHGVRLMHNTHTPSLVGVLS